MDDFRNKQVELVKLMIVPINIIIITVMAYLFLSYVVHDNVYIFGSKIDPYSFKKIVLIGGMFLSMASLMNKYLEYGLTRRDRINKVYFEDKYSDSNFVNGYDINNRLDEVYSRINNIEVNIGKLNDIERNLEEYSISVEDKSNIVKELKDSILKNSSDELVKEIQATISKSIPRERFERIRRHFNESINRLIREVEALARRAKVNLIIGSITAMGGVAIFVMFVIDIKNVNDATNYFLTNYTPRLSLVIVVEIFAYFFLGLYKSNLSEIKYYQNEITNIEFKALSLLESLVGEDMKTMNSILVNYSETERNFLLKKGESTVSLEERRFATEENTAIFNLLKDIAKKDKN
jgi:hypothetical protein